MKDEEDRLEAEAKALAKKKKKKWKIVNSFFFTLAKIWIVVAIICEVAINYDL